MSSIKPVNIALIGAGYWGRNYVRNLFSLPEANLSWVCDLDEKARDRAKKTAPTAQITSDLLKVLDDPDVEAVVIATNSIRHNEHTMAALRAGKHVLVEKPMAMSVRQAEEMALFAEDNKLTLMVGHLMLYHPAVKRLEEIITAEELGRIYYIYASRVNLGRIRKEENALWSFGPHDVSIILHLLKTFPQNVSARGESYLQPQIEDVVFVNLAFPNEAMAHIQLSWLDPRKERRLTVVGSRKMVIFDDAHPTDKLRICDKGVDKVPEYDSYGDYLTIRTGDVHVPHVMMTEPLTLECRHFLSCVADGTPCQTDAKQGLQVIRILEAAQLSIKQGGVPVNL